MIFIWRMTASRGLVNISGSSCGGKASKKALREGGWEGGRVGGWEGERVGGREGGREGGHAPSVEAHSVPVADSTSAAPALVGACLGKEQGRMRYREEMSE